MFDLITIGDTTIDVFHMLKDHEIHVSCSLNTTDCQLCMSYADKIPVAEIHRLVAGNATNNAVGAARLGLKTAIYTIVGADRAGEDIREQLEREGVDRDYLIVDQEGMTNYSTVLSFQGERTILVYHAPRAYRLPRLAKTDWVYLTSMADGSETIFSDLRTYLDRERAKLVYQPGTFQIRLGAAKSRVLLEVAELILLNKEEAIDYTQSDATISIRSLLAKLHALGPRRVVITDGRQGSFASDTDGVWQLGTDSTIPRTEVTGAGDAYAIGVTTALMTGQPLLEAMRWGTINAQSVIQQIGPQAGLLTRESMEHQLAKSALKGMPLEGTV